MPNGGLKWSNYWDIINHSREIFGPWKVNIHTVVGLGETDRDLIDTFYDLKTAKSWPICSVSTPSPTAAWPIIPSRPSAAGGAFNSSST